LDRDYSDAQQCFSSEQLSQILSSAGLQKVRIQNQAYISPAAAQAVLRPEALAVPFAHFSVWVDRVLTAQLPAFLRQFSWNLTAVARFRAERPNSD
jgi:hypothetical protein